MNNKKIGILPIILIIATIIMTFLGGTLALWNWQSAAAQNTSVSFTVASNFSCSADGGGNITNNDVMLVPASCTNSTHAIKREVKVNVNKNGESNVYLDMYLNVNNLGSGLANTPNFKYALTTSGTNCTDGVVAQGNFSGATTNTHKNLFDLKEYTTTTQNDTYFLWIWLDAAETNTATQNQAFDLSLQGSCTNIFTPKLASYISYTPTKLSYTIDSSKTGYSSATQTINPSELNLWRVISVNGDGTVDIISENVSSSTVTFTGKTGYMNLVGYLNTLASQYETSGITSGSRYFGYNGQTQYITDNSKFLNSSVPWYCSTGNSCNSVENQGGGDMLYTTDYNLITTIFGTAKAYKIGTTTVTEYWMASRNYYYASYNDYRWFGRSVDYSGSVIASLPEYLYDNRSYTNSSSNALRPIVRLKAGLTYSGSGTSDNPYVISAS